jgi:hypothetical protein
VQMPKALGCEPLAGVLKRISNVPLWLMFVDSHA